MIFKTDWLVAIFLLAKVNGGQLYTWLSFERFDGFHPLIHEIFSQQT